ncbi:Serine/threonine-protein kinase StkP [Novipirellula aureliae]|uniref:non-specific serine/threonine protein kinase n=1 Tax=Novipirellula aureliae TaxID=2527966 RepID=A0A5C6DSW6_9BACT|nr:serine/threonine-protein kinase [Novipirellula aureliae]TWU39848.1 Serine/threonine-protein kinase StkP [Novipirellula aureliae]
MVELPNLTPNQIESAITSVSDVQPLGRGGQKIVFSGEIDGERYALKFSRAPIETVESDEMESEYDPDVVVRAKREVETMRQCKSPHMVKLGPIGLEFIEISGERLIFFTEELITGSDLRQIKRGRCLSAIEVVRLGVQITHAIAAIWELKKVHRDIKPGNIMLRNDGNFVLLDAGLAFDKAGDSLSGGFLVGTRIYFSPEQFDYGNRRTIMDFRSDMFALGVTMYEMATGDHPFYTRGDGSENFFTKVMKFHPTPPHELVDNFPEDLSAIIMRMLGKSPHLRYRKCEQLIERLNAVGATS